MHIRYFGTSGNVQEQSVQAIGPEKSEGTTIDPTPEKFEIVRRPVVVRVIEPDPEPMPVMLEDVCVVTVRYV